MSPSSSDSTAVHATDSDTEDDVFDITSEESREKRKERNLETFRVHYPEIFRGMRKHTPSSELIITDGGEADVLFNNTYLYANQGAETYSRNQLDTFWKTPQRVKFNRPGYVDQDGATGWILNSVFEKAEKEGITFAPDLTSETAFYATVFGIGLGAHIDEIVEKSKCRCLLLVEPNLEFLYHSLSVYDWTGLIEKMADEGRKVRFIVSQTPDEINFSIRGAVRSVNPCGLDGMYMFFHFNNAILVNGAKLFQNDLGVVLMGLGFFEDELAMISQSYRNLKGGKARIMNDKHNPLNVPVFIIGGGPSLDQDIETVKKFKDKAVIIACGTSMEPLLKHDIVPDFNVLLERSELLLKAHLEAAEMFDLSKTTLLASTTIYPGIGELFGDVIYFFRAGLSSYPLFCTDVSQALPRCDPIVANGALAFAQRAGFKHTYFFGVDCGTKDAKRHHSKHSWYYDNRMTDYLHKFGQKLAANFGGTVYSNDVLMWSRDSLQNAIRVESAGRRYYNCSDGARIEGAVPKKASTVDLPDLPRPKEEIVKEIVERFPHYTEEIFDGAWEKGDLIAQIPEFTQKLIDAVESHDSLEDYAYHDDCNTLLVPGENKTINAMLFRGTAFLALIAFDHFHRRLEDPEKMGRLEELFKEGFRSGVEAMRDESVETFTALVEKY